LENISKYEFDSVLNFREINGCFPGNTDHSERKIIFRSANLDSISKSDIKKLYQHKIKTIIDLRGVHERKKNSRKIDNIERISFPLDFERATREKLYPYLYKKNSENVIADISNALYLEIFEASGKVVREILEILLSSDRCPLIIHCQAGKDRTGIISAIIQLALKADRDSVIKDYMKSNDFLIPYFKKRLLRRKILTLGFFPAQRVLYAVTLRQRNIESVLNRIDNDFGGIEAYLNFIGFDNSQLNKLREILIAG
jgi:protein-tyrosine phosphatase